MLSATQITTPTIGATLPFTVTRDGRTLTPVLTIRTDRRWLTERAVLSPASLATQQLVATGPGEVVVNVSAEGLTDSVTVRVVPPKPLVTALSGPTGRTHLAAGDTLTVRGYAMHQVTPTQLFPASLGLVAAAPSDSATLRLITSVETVGSCGGRAASYHLVPTNVDVEIPLTTSYTRARSGELTLAAGESAPLTSGATGCLRLAPAVANARYLLAWVDDRRIVQAQTQFEVPYPADMMVTLQDQSGPATLRAMPSVTPSAPSRTFSAGWSAGRMTSAPFPTSAALQQPINDPPFSACSTTPTSPDWAIYCRTTPWVVGATFNYQPIASGRAATTARIIAVSPKVVAAVIQADSSLIAPLALTRIQETLDFLSSQYLAFIRASFGNSRDPISSPGSGQLVVMFEAGGVKNTIRSNSDFTVPSGAFSHTSMLLTASNCYAVPQACNLPGVDEIMVHEIVHTAQFLWNRETRNGVQPFGQTWSLEGGAVLHQVFTDLERNGVSWTANTQFESFAPSDPRRLISVFTGGIVTSFTAGYFSSAAFLRDLMQRLVVEHNVPFTVAIQEVQIGAMEGWYGIGVGGVSYGQGLVPRMRARLGPSWDPVQAMLQWTMSEAADDLTNNPLYQDVTNHTSPREFNGLYVHNGISPSGGVTAGSGLLVSTSAPSGNSGVFQIDDPAAGGSYTTTSSVGPSVHWLLLRVR